MGFLVRSSQTFLSFDSKDFGITKHITVFIAQVSFIEPTDNWEPIPNNPRVGPIIDVQVD